MALEILELGEWVVRGVFGWRYIFSRSFREQTHRSWKYESWLTVVVLEVGISLTAVVFSLILFWLGVRAFLSLD
ncbi:MAG TPA: hypothetical protein VFD63_04360 [Pyrinomonadaceae bacterium]|nr:hypothetical protein [Pyrinomonadaceae bacterium]